MIAGPALVDRYFARIGTAPPRAPDRAGLAAIVAAHATAIPFEGIDPLLGRTVDLDLSAIAAKLIDGGRGGYCFEQNTLLRAVLRALGYRTSGLAARVLWMLPDGVETGRTHMLLRVTLDDGPAIVDVGFGAGAPTGVLDLVADTVQQTPHNCYRLTRTGSDWLLSIDVGQCWRPLYRFGDETPLDVDYRIANWFTSTSPQSHFVCGLTCARALPDRRLALRNFDLAIHHVGDATEKRRIESADALADLVRDDFGIRLLDRAAFVARIEQGLA